MRRREKKITSAWQSKERKNFQRKKYKTSVHKATYKERLVENESRRMVSVLFILCIVSIEILFIQWKDIITYQIMIDKNTEFGTIWNPDYVILNG
jgi:hypothetical protein